MCPQNQRRPSVRQNSLPNLSRHGSAHCSFMIQGVPRVPQGEAATTKLLCVLNSRQGGGLIHCLETWRRASQRGGNAQAICGDRRR